MERTKNEVDQRLDLVERETWDTLTEVSNMWYEIEAKITEKINHLAQHKSDSVSEILKLKNDLYSFVDSKLTHNQTISERRLDAIHTFANDSDLRIKKLMSYWEDIEMQLEEAKIVIVEKTSNLS